MGVAMSPDPQLIVFAGLPGTGKTSLARAVARELAAVYLDKDTIKECILAQAAELKVEQGEKLAGPLSYELLVSLARDNLTLGLSVVLDSPAAYQLFRDKVKQLARAVRADLRLIECICTDEKLLRQHVEGRGPDAPAFRTRDWATYQRERAQFERLTDRRLVVDTAESVATNLRKVLRYLGHHRLESGLEE
jgi:predicted kinase